LPLRHVSGSSRSYGLPGYAVCCARLRSVLVSFHFAPPRRSLFVHVSSFTFRSHVSRSDGLFNWVERCSFRWFERLRCCLFVTVLRFLHVCVEPFRFSLVHFTFWRSVVCRAFRSFTLMVLDLFLRFCVYVFVRSVLFAFNVCSLLRLRLFGYVFTYSSFRSFVCYVTFTFIHLFPFRSRLVIYTWTVRFTARLLLGLVVGCRLLFTFPVYDRSFDGICCSFTVTRSFVVRSSLRVFGSVWYVVRSRRSLFVPSSFCLRCSTFRSHCRFRFQHRSFRYNVRSPFGLLRWFVTLIRSFVPLRRCLFVYVGLLVGVVRTFTVTFRSTIPVPLFFPFIG